MSGDFRGGSPLGNITKLGARPAVAGVDSGKLRRFEAMQYVLQEYNRVLLPRFVNINSKRRKLRAKNCMCWISSMDGLAKVMFSAERNKYFWKGLMVCGSVHCCPICGYKIRRRKADEIEKVILAHESAGGGILMLSLTAPHTREDELPMLRRKLKNAERGFQCSKAVMKIKREIGFIEPIKVWEDTFGHENGWHPHSHQLWFVDKGVDIERLEELLFPHWANYCVKRGLDKPSREHGLNIVQGFGASNYITKMGINSSIDLSKELTGGMFKQARGKRYVPFDLLLLAGQDDKTPWALGRWVEYIKATFGSPFISRYPKLKALYDVDDKSDEELLNEEQEKAVLIALIGMAQFGIIVKYGLKHKVLKMFERGDSKESVLSFITSVKRLG